MILLLHNDLWEENLIIFLDLLQRVHPQPRVGNRGLGNIQLTRVTVIFALVQIQPNLGKHSIRDANFMAKRSFEVLVLGINRIHISDSISRHILDLDLLIILFIVSVNDNREFVLLAGHHIAEYGPILDLPVAIGGFGPTYGVPIVDLVPIHNTGVAERLNVVGIRTIFGLGYGRHRPVISRIDRRSGCILHVITTNHLPALGVSLP
mmetsp:Transcript_32619/g.96144  ORF Transcript_32619/g.96144 Transcript_32619/m.96144 type:complete len:207 (+) Transcript_32619:1602-2222(+)